MKVDQPKGTPLELDTAAYFQAHGYFVRRGVSLAVSATADVTDIDLLGIRFSNPLSEERLVSDCKDRRKPKPFERILWTMGLGAFAGAQRKVIVSPQAPWQAYEFASRGGVEILSVNQISDFLSKTQMYERFGDADPALWTRYAGTKKICQNILPTLSRDHLRLRQLLVVGHPITSFNRAIQILGETHRQLTKISGDALWLARFICFDAAAIASVMLVRFATESKWTPEIDWSDHARKRLTFGDISPTKVKLLVKLALDQNTLSGIPEPTYTDEIIAAIKLLIERQEIAIHVPNMIDLTLSKISNGQASPEVLPGVNTALVPQIDATSKRILSAIGFAADLGPDWIKPTAAVAEQSSGSLPASHSSA